MPRVLATLFLCISAGFAASAGAVDIIAHRSTKTESLSTITARSIFAMRQANWPDGSAVRVYVLPDQHPTHAAFCKETLNLYPYQLRQTWDRQVYSGIGQAPTELGSEEEMLEKVATTPGAIGYVRKVRPHDSVRVIQIQ